MNKSTLASIPRVDATWTAADWWGATRVRCKYGRDHYRVEPRLYRTGSPTLDSPVLVTANYKLTFDHLRSDVARLDAWILVLDTRGVNVWCAAGKGTFSTDELVRRIEAVGLGQYVTHQTVILPQLGAPGVAAHDVTKRTGFKVVYGPVRSSDIPTFLNNGMKATPAMRAVTFPLWERLLVTPVELIGALPRLGQLFAVIVIGSLIRGLPLALLLRRYWCPTAGAVVAGCVGVPALLPALPGRAFAVKGWLLGLVTTLINVARSGGGPCTVLGHLLVQPVITAYFALNFTGATPMTSESGVKKEIAQYVTPMKVLAVLGLAFLGCGILRDDKRS